MKRTVVTCLALLTFCYASALCQAAREASAIDKKEITEFASWVRKNGLSPLDYLVSKCAQHQVVLLGEQHEIRDNVAFLGEALPELYERSGVTCLALEVCNAEDDTSLERLVMAPVYDEELALAIARSENWGFWGFKEYWDLLRTVWELNRNLPDGRQKMRVIGIDRKMDLVALFKWKQGLLKDSAEVAALKKQFPLFDGRDALMADQIDSEIIQKGEKAIVLVGNMHAFTHYRQPQLKDGKWTDGPPRMGHILHDKYGDKVFQVSFHLDAMSPSVVDTSYRSGPPVLIKLIESITASSGKDQVGFDIFTSPMATLRDSNSYYFHFQPTVLFQDVCRGYIFLAPWKELHRTGWIRGFISDEMFERERTFFETKFNRKFADAAELNHFFEIQAKEPIGQ